MRQDKYQAVCDCGNITIHSDADPVLQMICHCQQCRDFTKKDFSSMVLFSKDNVHFDDEGNHAKLAINEVVADSGNTVTRAACLQCDALIYDKSSGFPDMLGFYPQLFKAPFIFSPRLELWTQEKVSDESVEGITQSFVQDFA